MGAALRGDTEVATYLAEMAGAAGPRKLRDAVLSHVREGAAGPERREAGMAPPSPAPPCPPGRRSHFPRGKEAQA